MREYLDYEKVENLFNEGVPVVEISKQLNKSYGTIY